MQNIQAPYMINTISFRKKPHTLVWYGTGNDADNYGYHTGDTKQYDTEMKVVNPRHDGRTEVWFSTWCMRVGELPHKPGYTNQKTDYQTPNTGGTSCSCCY